ncbi:DNA repair protein RecN [Acholeplasma granularum]|uniref:DNA repair protein RecN n=1 Tax=Acholeplasma granularum TaxID=264635 RepID=UPI00046F53CA|nr:DNA repair protein RecN [Acholeplasma granularum]
MLQHLEVKNFALIDDLDIIFEHGLTALTGETGSGKSILLESLSLLFGKRSDSEFIRTGAKKAIVKGTFKLNTHQMNLLELPNTITLLREIDLSGKHVVKLNDEIITVSKLKEITSHIGLIHGQNDTFQLLDKETYVNFIDQMDNELTQNLINEYMLKRSLYLDGIKHFESLKNKKKETQERLDFLKFQINELESFNLKKGEKDLLEENVSKLKNYDKIMQSLNIAYQTFEGQAFQTDALYDAYKAIQSIKSFDKSYEDVAKILEESYYNLEESRKLITNFLELLDFDSDLFNNYQERLYELSKIETKYGKSNDDLVTYLESLKDELELSSDYDGYLKKAHEKNLLLYKEVFKIGTKLHQERVKLSKKLEKLITESLHELDLEKAQFKIEFDQITEGMQLKENGLDSVEFLISLNEGEPLKALAKVASGGEKARFMFSLKSIYAKNNLLSLLVFDEIDIGISGKTATKVANKMKSHAKDIQMLVITHLPQVAAKADHHYRIYKTKVNDRMQTLIEVLDKDARILSIASMLSDAEMSHFAIEQAKTLLNM